MPPEVSVAYLFSGLQSDLRFPFTVVQNFTSVDFRRMSQGILGLSLREKMAVAMARHRESAEFVREASALTEAVFSEKACVFHWYFAIVVSGADLHELESRVSKISTYMKRLRGSEVLEERENRVLGELATLPGNSRYGLRYNVVTSRNAGRPGHGLPALVQGTAIPSSCSAIVRVASTRTRCSPGESRAGARRCSARPGRASRSCCSRSCWATPPSRPRATSSTGETPSVRSSSCSPARARATWPSCASRAARSSSIRCPWSGRWRRRARQMAAGTYQLALEDGSRIPCPVAEAKVFFEAWLEGLLGQGDMLPMDRKNRLDRALKGASGKGGFFKDFEIQCRRYIEDRRRGAAASRRARCGIC